MYVAKDPKVFFVLNDGQLRHKILKFVLRFHGRIFTNISYIIFFLPKAKVTFTESDVPFVNETVNVDLNLYNLFLYDLYLWN